jgi:hypothetical protein
MYRFGGGGRFRRDEARRRYNGSDLTVASGGVASAPSLSAAALDRLVGGGAASRPSIPAAGPIHLLASAWALGFAASGDLGASLAAGYAREEKGAGGYAGD